MNYTYLTGRKFAIWAVSENDNGETESAIFTGTALWKNGHLYLRRGRGYKQFQIPDDTLEKIKPVPTTVSDILLNAEFYVPIYIAPLPVGANPQEYLPTGLKWPE